MKELKDFYRNKKVFITGHSGFKGSWLCTALMCFGAEIKGYSLEPPTEPALFNVLGLRKKTETVFADIRDLNRLTTELELFKPDIVFHLAAQPLVRQSYKDPVETYSTNVMGTVNLLEACRNSKTIKSIVNITTDKVYENMEWAWGYRENERLCGFDPYSNSKSCSELVTYSYKNCFFSEEESPAVSTARSGNVIGGGDFSLDRIIPDCVRAAAGNQDIIVRNPFSTRPYQHVLECLRGYLVLAKKQYENKEYQDSYNFGPDEKDCLATGQLTALFCESWGKVSWLNKSDNGPHEANFLKLDCSKAKNVLNWYPKLNIVQAIDLTVAWYKAYYLNKDITLEQTEQYFFDKQ